MLDNTENHNFDPSAPELSSPVPLSFAPDGTFITFGSGEDIDNALDDATSSAWFDLGRAQVLPSVASTNPSSVKVHPGDALPFDAAVLTAQIIAGSVADGETIAIAVQAPNAYKRRRVNVKIEDVALDIDATVGPVTRPTAELLAAIEALSGKEQDEIIGSVELRKHRARYKPLVEKNSEGREVTWELFLVGTDAPLGAYASATLARRAAIELSKAAPAETGVQQYEIRGRVNRATGLPFITIVRSRVFQQAVLKVELHRPNPAAKAKLTGFVFVGRPAKK